MRKIPLHEAQVGQTVARAVTNANGTVLVQAGATLTSALIERLATLGLDAIVVSDASYDVPRKSTDDLLRELERRFAGHEGDELMMDLKALMAAHIRERGGVSGAR